MAMTFNKANCKRETDGEAPTGSLNGLTQNPAHPIGRDTASFFRTASKKDFTLGHDTENRLLIINGMKL